MQNIAFYLLAFHLVFSGLISYHEYVGNIPTMSYLTIIVFGIPFLFYLTLYFVRLFVQKNSIRFLWRNALFGFCIAYIGAAILVNHLVTYHSMDVLLFNVIILIWYIISFYIGSQIQLYRGKKLRKIVLALYFLFALNVLLAYSSKMGRMVVNYDHLGIFLFLGDTFAIWSLLTISFYNKKYLSVFLVFISAICLYMISSRSSLYGFLFILPFVFKNTKNGWIQFTFICAVFIACILFVLNAETLMSSRMLRFIFTGYDHSFYLRELIMERNVDDIFNNWFLGDYAGQLRHGEFGYYIHNYLSLWRQFGIIPFVIFIALLLPFFKWFYPWMRGKKYQEYDFLFYLIIFLLVEIIFTRAYKSHFIWIAIGMMTNVINIENKRIVRKRLKLKNEAVIE